MTLVTIKILTKIFSKKIKKIAEQFHKNPKLLNELIRIQSRVRGINVRNSVRKNQKKKQPFQSYNSSFTKENQLENESNYASIQVDDNGTTNNSPHLRGARLNQFSDNKNQQENNLIENQNKEILNKITKEDLQELLNKYPSLNDGINVSIRPIVEYENGSIYYGEWDPSTNKRHGRGIQLWPDGNKYSGLWKNDKANIKGKLEHDDGDYYEGEWKDDKAEGHGVYCHIDGAKYDGGWKSDKQHGFGIEIWPDGSKYEGNYENGFKSGKGIFTWGDGSVYEGNFENNNINGKGTYLWKDKRRFDGDWVDNKMEGKGVFKWPDGRVYNGEYKNDKKDGYGEFSWNDGRKYKGYWKDGKQNGNGNFFNPKYNEWKEGIWQNGKRIKWIEIGDKNFGKQIE